MRLACPQALEAVGPGGRLYILDERELTKLASDTGAELEFRRLYRGYADYAVITKPA